MHIFAIRDGSKSAVFSAVFVGQYLNPRRNFQRNTGAFSRSYRACFVLPFGAGAIRRFT
jgi:hypothetical protein